MDMACYRCGSVDHVKANCPTAPPRAEPAPAAAPLPPRRPPEEIADAEAWADRIRAQNGWSRHRGETRVRDLQALAGEQVAESRASRMIA